MSADQLLTALFNAGIAISIGATVLSLGMTFTVAQLLAPLRRVWLVVAVVVLSAVVIPAVAWGIATILPINETTSTDSCSPHSVQAQPVRSRPRSSRKTRTFPSLSPWWSSFSSSTSCPSRSGLFVALAAGISVNWQTIVDLFGSWVLVASLLIIAIAVGLGLLLGGTNAQTRTTTGLVSGMRFGSLGLIIIGTQLDGSASYLGPALVFTLLDFVLPLLLAIEIGRRTQVGTSEPRAT